MKLVTTTTTYYVNHDGYDYRTTDGKNWEIRFGEAWDFDYFNSFTLSKLFAEMVAGSRTEHLTEADESARPMEDDIHSNSPCARCLYAEAGCHKHYNGIDNCPVHGFRPGEEESK